MAHVFVTRQLPGPAMSRLMDAHRVTVWPGRLPPPPDRLAEHSASAEGLITLLSDSVDRTLLEGSPHLRVVSNYAVGLDNIDLAAAAERGVAVGHTPDVLTEATADLAFALLLAAARRLPEALAVARTDWLTWEPAGLLGRDVHGATLGIVGPGRIGRAVARRAAGFQMDVILAGSGDEAALDALLREADFVSLHCPLTPRTHHLIDAGALARMKPTAILVNTARGAVVDSEALAEALRAGSIAGAALDVTDPEPLAPDHPLHAAPKLLIVPHIGSATSSTRHRMTEIAVENVLAGLAGCPLPHPAPVAQCA